MPFHIVQTLQLGGYGWTEEYYASSGTLNQLGFRPTAILVARARLRLCARFTRIMSVSIRDVDVQRASVFATDTNDEATDANPQERDVPHTAAVLRFVDATLQYKRPMWLRGLPDDAVKFDGLKMVVDPVWNTRLTNFAVAMISAGMLIRAWNKSRLGAFVPKPILSVRPHLARPRVDLEVRNHNFVLGQRVDVSGCVFSSTEAPGRKINRDHLVILPPSTGRSSTDWFSINVPPGALTGGMYLGGGVVRRKEYAYIPVKSFALQRFDSRSTGPSKSTSRGRRRAIVRPGRVI